jgi:hypothetical protein
MSSFYYYFSLHFLVFVAVTSLRVFQLRRWLGSHLSSSPCLLHASPISSFSIRPSSRSLNLFIYRKSLLVFHAFPKLENCLFLADKCIFNTFANPVHVWRPSSPSAIRGRPFPWLGTNLTWYKKWNVFQQFLRNFILSVRRIHCYSLEFCQI